MRYSRPAMLHIPKIQAITLDLDDTLWPIGPTIALAEQALQDWLCLHAPRTAQLCAQVETRQEIRRIVQIRHTDQAHDLSFLRREAIRESLLRAGDAQDLAQAAFEVFFAARQQVRLFDGVEEALARLSQRYALVAVSNGNADVFCTPAGPYFKTSLSARAFGVAKPDVRIFEAAAAQLGLAVEAVLHVGDDCWADAAGALNAGMQAVWINADDRAWTHAVPQPLTVRHLSELCYHLLP
jgi:FMN hydrolase / 5-amino-6-(5-phospho-D-ribitylamino)uracil phosphatase